MPQNRTKEETTLYSQSTYNDIAILSLLAAALVAKHQDVNAAEKREHYNAIQQDMQRVKDVMRYRTKQFYDIKGDNF